MSTPWKVLIVDDEMLIRQGIINYINWEAEGFQIVGEASNGNEALTLIEKEQPHIIITDVVMPGMDGIELVKEVKAQYPKIEIIVLSSFENFDYVRSTFQSGVADYVLKPKLNGEDLIRTLRKIVPNNDESEQTYQSKTTIEELLQKNIQGYSLMNSKDILENAFPYNCFSLIAVYWSAEKGEVMSYKDISEKLKSSVSGLETYFIPLDVSGATMVVNYNSENLPFIKAALAHLASKSDEELNWLLSIPFSTIDEIKEVYDENLLKMKDYFFFLYDRKLLIYDELPKVMETKRHFDLNQFMDFFKHKQFDVAIQYLSEHVATLSNNYTKDIFEYKSWLENIIFNIIVLLENMKYDTTELETKKYDYFSNINEAEHANEAIACFYEFLDVVKKLVIIERDQRPTNMKKLLQYIDEHYSEALSLTTLANHFHFNPSYLSSYFSTHHQEGFSEYLNQVRINKAKLILESSSTPIATVSEMVGYSDPSYFCKVFKRIEGISPSSYRKTASATN